MTLNYNGTQISGGGAKLRFNNKLVSKIHYGNQLVYKNMLSIGTVLLQSDTDYYSSDIDITFNSVNSDWSNIPNGIKITYSINGVIKTMEFEKSNLLSTQNIFLNGTIVSTIRRINNTNKIRITSFKGKASTVIHKVEVI